MSIQFMAGKESFKLLDYSQHGVFVLDCSMTVLFWNKELESWTGIYTKEIVGRRIDEFFPYLSAEPFKTDLKKVFAGAGSKMYSSRKGQTVIEHKSDSGQPITQRTIVTGMDSDTEGKFLALFTLKDVHASSEGNVEESIPGKGTILVVDDEESIRLAVSRVLASNGYGVHVSKSAEDALEYIDQKSEAPKAVVLDMMMPGMKGQEALPHLRNKLPKVPIIACTGMSLKEFSAQNIERVVQGVVHKPFAVNELLDTLGAALGTKIDPIPPSYKPAVTPKSKGLPSPASKDTPVLKKASEVYNKPTTKTSVGDSTKPLVSASRLTEDTKIVADAMKKLKKAKPATEDAEKVVVKPRAPGVKSSLKLKR